MSQRSQKRTQKSSSQRQPQPGPSSQANGTQYEDDTMVEGSQIETSLSEQEHNQYVANVVKYILAADQTKIPIARTTLSKCAGFQGMGKNFRAIMKSAEEMLNDVFGYKIIDVDGKIILLNEISEIADLHYSEDVELRHSLLFLVLSHIFMNGEVCTETSLMNFLTRANIIVEGNPKHGDFGNVIEIINNDFVKEKYIDVIKADSTDKEKEFKWGKRAEKELPVRAVMQFASLVYGRRGIETWPQQFNAMKLMEQRTGTMLLHAEEDNDEDDDVYENGTQNGMEVEDD